jgi:hypothetical protein
MSQAKEEMYISDEITVDSLIEKFIPIVGAILFISWLWYLIYTSVWALVPELMRISIWFIASILIILWGIKLGDKTKYFWDIVIGWGVLLLYGTLMYWSRVDGIDSATIPEVWALLVSFLFTWLIGYFAEKRKSKEIVIMSLIGAYLVPFVIWQNGSWQQTISFNSYLIYFTGINVMIFQMIKGFELRSIVPVNLAGLLFWTTTLYSLSYAWETTSSSGFFDSSLFSIVLFFVLTLFSIASLIISTKDSESEYEAYLALGYLWIIVWFIWNLYQLTWVTDWVRSVFFFLLWVSCFMGWNLLWKKENRYEHSTLYFSGILTVLLGIVWYIPNDFRHVWITLWYIGLVFWFLYFVDTTKKERLTMYYLFAIIWALYSILIDLKSVSNFWGSIYIIISVIPLLGGYFFTKNDISDNSETRSIWKSTSIIWLVIIGGVIFLEFLSLLNGIFNLALDFLDSTDTLLIYFYLLPLFLIIYISKSTKLWLKVKTNILRVLLWVFWIGFVETFFRLLGMLYPASESTHIFTEGSLFAYKDAYSTVTGNEHVLKGLLWLLVLYFWYKLSVLLFESDYEDEHPFHLIASFYYIVLLLTWTQVIFAILNDLQVSHEHGSIRAIWVTLYWMSVAVFLVYSWVKKWIDYSFEKKLWITLVMLTLVKIIFYDLSTMSLQNKIVILMLVGWLLLVFSYFSHKNWWLQMNKIIPSKRAKKGIVENLIEKSVEVKKHRVNMEIENIDVSDISSIKFILNTGKSFQIKTKNLFKITKIIIQNTWKTTFHPEELSALYETIVANYTTGLSDADYEKVKTRIKEFVVAGWEVVVIKHD